MLLSGFSRRGPSLTVSPAHSSVRLTSALHISSAHPPPTLIPPPLLPQDSAQSVFFFLTLIKAISPPPPGERLERLFSEEPTPSTFPVRAETFFPGALCSLVKLWGTVGVGAQKKRKEKLLLGKQTVTNCPQTNSCVSYLVAKVLLID